MNKEAQGSATMAQAITDFFVKLSFSVAGCQLVFENGNIKRFKSIYENSTQRFRIYTLFAKVSQTSGDSLMLCKSSGIFQGLLSDLKIDDYLVKLNAIELCSELLDNSGLCKFLDDLGVFELLSQYLKSNEDSELVESMCTSKTLSIFSELSKLRDIEFLTFARRFDLFNSILRLLYFDGNSDIQESAVMSVGIIGSTLPGLRILENETLQEKSERSKKPKNLLIPGTSLLYHLINIFTRDKNMKQDLKIACLKSLTIIFETRENAPGDGSKPLLEKLYESIETTFEDDARPNDPSWILSLVKDPRELVRYAAYGFVQAVVSHLWGRKRIISTPGFLDHILDRSTEGSKEGKEWKFAIVQALGSTVASDNLHHDILGRLMRYVREGPFYTRTQAEVEGISL